MHLVLGPGGIGGVFSISGCVCGLKNFDDIIEVSGSSAGSIIGFLICMGFSPTQIKKIVLGVDISKFKIFNIKNFFKNFGFVEWSHLINELGTYIYDIENITFKDLRKKFYVSAFCLNTSKIHYFSRDTDPDMPVIQAVCMSCSIPFVFESLLYKGYRYIDSFIYEVIPLVPFLDKKKNDVTIIKTLDNCSAFTEIKTFKDFIFSIVDIILTNRQSDLSGGYNVYELNIDRSKLVNFNLTNDDCEQLYMDGFLMSHT